MPVSDLMPQGCPLLFSIFSQQVYQFLTTLISIDGVGLQQIDVSIRTNL